MILGVGPYQFIEIFPHYKPFVSDSLYHTRNHNDVHLFSFGGFLLCRLICLLGKWILYWVKNNFNNLFRNGKQFYTLINQIFFQKRRKGFYLFKGFCRKLKLFQFLEEFLSIGDLIEYFELVRLRLKFSQRLMLRWLTDGIDFVLRWWRLLNQNLWLLDRDKLRARSILRRIPALIFVFFLRIFGLALFRSVVFHNHFK